MPTYAAPARPSSRSPAPPRPWRVRRNVPPAARVPWPSSPDPGHARHHSQHVEADVTPRPAQVEAVAFDPDGRKAAGPAGNRSAQPFTGLGTACPVRQSWREVPTPAVPARGPSRPWMPPPSDLPRIRSHSLRTPGRPATTATGRRMPDRLPPTTETGSCLFPGPAKLASACPEPAMWACAGSRGRGAGQPFRCMNSSWGSTRAALRLSRPGGWPFPDLQPSGATGSLTHCQTTGVAALCGAASKKPKCRKDGSDWRGVAMYPRCDVTVWEAWFSYSNELR